MNMIVLRNVGGGSTSLPINAHAHFAKNRERFRKIIKTFFILYPTQLKYIAGFSNYLDDAEHHGDVYFCLTQTFDRF